MLFLLAVDKGPNCPMPEESLVSFSESLTSLSYIFIAPYEMGKRPSANCSLALLRFSVSFLDIHSFNGFSSFGSLPSLLSSPPTDDMRKHVSVAVYRYDIEEE